MAVYQYMRLCGYPADRIALLTTYNGQKQLLRDIVRKRCSKYALFGEPASIDTVDKYQGQQADFVLLSLVRTKAVGHIRDVRRIVVAMSRARLGLYVFCREQLFANCLELSPVLSHLRSLPTKLHLFLGESQPTSRKASETTAPEGSKLAEITSAQELGEIVSKIAAAHVYMLTSGNTTQMPPPAPAPQKKKPKHTPKFRIVEQRKTEVLLGEVAPEQEDEAIPEEDRLGGELLPEESDIKVFAPQGFGLQSPDPAAFPPRALGTIVQSAAIQEKDIDEESD